MAVIKNTVFGELIVAITDEEGSEVEMALAGLEEKYSIYISTRSEAIKSLREIANWLEMQEQS